MAPGKRAKRLVQQKLFNATHRCAGLTIHSIAFPKNLFRIREGLSAVMHMAAAAGRSEASSAG
jgi:hypothetical protein